ncbi:hypothetical protein LQ567_16500 [Niabella pedocola]|uniref:Uncharacterized protein n=1 Tax=Niabella pedocola TaxID=1752077 RepID=A0ABS8PVS8_9BACT|nr:hypothetical protein [Niabella pedocola]MCD2424382.1 hypothetical protein [Niabella pedocola]
MTPIINGKNAGEFFPHLKQWDKRISKVVIYHIDGHVDEMKLTFPIWTFWSEPGELSQYYLSQFVFHLTKCIISPERFEIFIGSIDSEGNEHYSFSYKFEIPIGKVFVKGKWLDPENERQNVRGRDINE